jgi:hypothetical protein
MSSSAPVSEADPSDRKRRLRNLSGGVGNGLYEEIRESRERD